MAGKIQLKLKPKAPTEAAPAATGAAAPAFAPAAGKSGGITIELRGTSVHIAQVVVVKR